jgi:hemerythrin
MKNALYIIWSDNNNLDIPIIDEQHRGIVSTINTFHFFTQEGQGIDALKPTLVALGQYITLHFKAEESLMKEAGYPGFNDHILLHKELLKKTIDIAKAATLHNDTDAVLKFLKEWWLGHINVEDRKYAPYVRNKMGIK